MYYFFIGIIAFSSLLAAILNHLESIDSTYPDGKRSGRDTRATLSASVEGNTDDSAVTLSSDTLTNEKDQSTASFKAIPTAALPPSLDLTRTTSTESDPNHPPQLRISQPDFLESFFNRTKGDEIEIPFSDAFVFVGKVDWIMSQIDTNVKALAATNKTSTLHLERYSQGHYGGYITHRDSTLAHQLTPQTDGSLLIAQIPYSDIICAPKGATPESGGGLPSVSGAGENGSQARNANDPLGIPTGPGNPTSGPPSGPLAAPTPTFDSRPSARAVIYLDFDGQIVTGTLWNTANNTPTITAAASSLSTAEMQRVCEIVAEDYSPFDVSVTTDETRFNRASEDSRIRVIITPTDDWYRDDVGGVAYTDTFTSSGDTPCWVFENNIGNKITGTSAAASHEIGHTMGLHHDGLLPDEEYYDGVTTPVSWGPIMGTGYISTYTQWSKGEYLNASNTEDDLSILTTKNNFGYRADDKSNTFVGARPIEIAQTITGVRTVADSGVIEKSSDIDVMSFKAGSGPLNMTINPLPLRPNLNLKAEILNQAGSVILSGESTTNSPTVSFSSNLTAGNYFLRISGIGLPKPSGNPPFPYDTSGYGSIGQYWINGTYTAPVSIISLTPTSLTQSLNEGTNGGTQSFKIAKQGKETTVNYVVEANASWLSVSPERGSIVGVGNANISVRYNSGALAPGTYTAAITVTAPDAIGSPATIPVSLTVSAPGAKIGSPTGLSASDGEYRDRIYISWNSVSGASHYDVYRSATNNRNTASLVSTTTSTFFYDAEASSGKHYYWVRARNASSKGVSDLIGSDPGHYGISAASVGNDDFARSIPLSGKSRNSLTGYNFAATNEPNEPRHAGAIGGHSVWANWTAPANGTLTVDTEYSDFDTVLAVYTGSSLTNLKRVASNDNIAGALNRASRVTFRTRAKTTYYIALDGKNGARGDYSLNLRFTDYSKSPRVSVSRAGKLRARLSWSSSGYETKYQIQGQYPKSKGWRQIRNVPTYPRSLPLSNLKKKGTYRFRVIPFQWNIQATKPGISSRIRF